MRKSWLLSVGACALWAGVTAAQPAPSRTLPASGRSAVPADPRQPANRAPDQAGSRGFTQSVEDRAILPPAAIHRLQTSDQGSRTVVAGADARASARTLVAPSGGREFAAGRGRAGEPGNKEPEAATARGFATGELSREVLPATRRAPADRQTTNDHHR